MDQAPGPGPGARRPRGRALLQLRYRHSVYGQPAVEEFAVTPAGLRLVRLASPSVAVLEYYARPEPIRPAPEGYEIRVLSGPPVPRLTLLASETGQRTVRFGGRELPLATLAGDGHRVSLAVTGAPAGRGRAAQRATWEGVDTGTSLVTAPTPRRPIVPSPLAAAQGPAPPIGLEEVPPERVSEVIEAYEAEAPTRTLTGFARRFVAVLSVGPLPLRPLLGGGDRPAPGLPRLLPAPGPGPHLRGLPRRARQRARVTALDWALVGLSVVALGWPLVDYARFPYRAAEPLAIDLVLGTLTILLVLEATRRTVGWILPVTAVLFVALRLPRPPAGAGRPGRSSPTGGTSSTAWWARLYMTLEGIFGVPLDVASTYIILFTIYGAVLESSGAGRFFLDWSMAAMGRNAGGAGPGRTVTLAGFLLGTVSGSGVATTVTLGAVSWPLLRRAGYGAEVGGAILSAGGIGAILSPPTLGAAAFLIAEFLNISYLQVLVMATVPTLLYYLSIFLMIEADSRRLGTRAGEVETPSLWELTRRYGYHFSSLFAIAILMALGMSAFRAVFWATLLAVALSFVRRETALAPAAPPGGPRRRGAGRPLRGRHHGHGGDHRGGGHPHRAGAQDRGDHRHPRRRGASS